MIAAYPSSLTSISYSTLRQIVTRSHRHALPKKSKQPSTTVRCNDSDPQISTGSRALHISEGIDSAANAANRAARVLIVEDESIVALDLRNTLRRLGYQVTFIASSGEEAVNSVIQATPDLILMDIRLHGQIDGIQAAAMIKSRFDIPVIFLTAQSDEITRRRAEAVSPASYITKPYSPTELHSAMTAVLEAWKAAHEPDQNAHT